MKKHLIFDLDWTLIKSNKELINLVWNFLVEKYNLDKEELLYFFNNTRWVALKEQIHQFMKVNEQKAEEITQEIYKLIRDNEKTSFFDWVPEKIKELSKNYKIYLSTWNSTAFAEKKLKEWWIFDCFEYILWSDIHLKWENHINIFKDFSRDENFEKNFIFIWDWQKDREIAKMYNNHFIHIDEELLNEYNEELLNEYNDEFEIKSVADIDNILQKIKD